ncbi:hypothetical protein ACXU4B_09505 [Dyella soli]|uniref:Uncharacterized protein n=1 Tax=Dyella soli TaxID=522319 RepID=A0A4R0YW13_9GAMM|nr:hypothetical protein [Dyella soli]TCI11173.1 hypothetical protein EZM97_20395 [Dyella soli]
MRYLAILLLAPWLLVLGWAYWTFPRDLPRIAARRVFDVAVLLLAAFAAWQCAAMAFDAAVVPGMGQYGRTSGAIWQQVLPALYGYGACVLVLLLALVVRQLMWRRRAH